MVGEEARLVESALREFRPVQGHGNDQGTGGQVRCQLGDGAGEEAAEGPGGGEQRLVLEGVNGVPHPALIGTAGHGAFKWRRGQAAGPASTGFNVSGVEAIFTAGTERLGMKRNFSPA